MNAADLSTVEKPSDDGGVLIVKQPSADAVQREISRFSKWVLNIGFLFALVLAAGCLVFGAIYLYNFLSSTNSSIDQVLQTATRSAASQETAELAIQGRTVVARIVLLSCGVFVGMSFGFLGFALFLVGIQQEMSVDAKYESYGVKFGRMSPAVFVILIATILIAICVTRRTPFDYERNGRGSNAAVPNSTPNSNNVGPAGNQPPGP